MGHIRVEKGEESWTTMFMQKVQSERDMRLQCQGDCNEAELDHNHTLDINNRKQVKTEVSNKCWKLLWRQELRQARGGGEEFEWTLDIISFSFFMK